MSSDKLAKDLDFLLNLPVSSATEQTSHGAGDAYLAAHRRMDNLHCAAKDMYEALRYAHRNGIDETFWQMALAATQKAEGR